MGSYKMKIAHDNESFELIDFKWTPLSTRINDYCMKKYHITKDNKIDKERGAFFFGVNIKYNLTLFVYYLF